MNKSNTTNKSETDWARVDAMTDEEIDFSDNPKVAREMFTRAVPRNKQPSKVNGQESLALDRDILEFFKAQGRDYQTQINQLLRAYMEARQTK
ncbi:MAG: BrnA antitoxin family protein [Acidobacteriota bacterium]|nr:BrnA antitoxin family protein [Acidobacteriota bacterium]